MFTTKEKYITGICKQMCPLKETKMREKQRLLHKLEILPGTENYEIPLADTNRVVKSFSRSAAGKSFLDPENLRPPEVLLQTVNYLLDEIINNHENIPWIVKYDFIMDRLRAVRQDMVIQNISRAHQIVILQPIIRFHAYSAYRCCEENINSFDPHINNTHLQECLKRLLCMYDYYDNLEKHVESDKTITNQFLEESRPYFEALYIIFNLGDIDAINRSLELPLRWRTSLVTVALKISQNYINRNFFRLCRLFKELPTTLQMMLHLHMPEIRRLTLKIMSVGYNNKMLTFPLGILANLLLYNTESELRHDCKHFGLKINENGICFLKVDFIEDRLKVKPSRSENINNKLKELDIPTLLLYGE